MTRTPKPTIAEDGTPRPYIDEVGVPWCSRECPVAHCQDRAYLVAGGTGTVTTYPCRPAVAADEAELRRLREAARDLLAAWDEWEGEGFTAGVQSADEVALCIDSLRAEVDYGK